MSDTQWMKLSVFNQQDIALFTIMNTDKTPNQHTSIVLALHQGVQTRRFSPKKHLNVSSVFIKIDFRRILSFDWTYIEFKCETFPCFYNGI